MRQEHETAKSFNELKVITQTIMLKKKAQENATHQESERTQEANNANAKAHTQEPTQARAQTTENAQASDITHQPALKIKNNSVKAKKGRLNPTKKAFSERQITAFSNSQASANSRRGTKQSHNANALTTEQSNNSNLRAMQSDEAQKQGLANNPSNQKGGE
ncbi:hypothetical protein [Helicobacter pylori]|uniref:hypothetical protein n=1 Tax=Helicobacter pylori TaxID=210 RepID=UPI00271220B7|nr:hypothetical protein [Helicobacter pylori]MDO7825928.1 hypothetical protein [Helicobacter pylori]